MENKEVVVEPVENKKAVRKPRVKSTPEVKFDRFVDELAERFNNFGMNRSSFGDDYTHAKIDTLIYALIKKGVITIEELIGTRDNNNQLNGGYISEYLYNLKTLVDARR